MSSDRRDHVDQLLQSALDVPMVERDGYLRKACRGDDRLEEEVRSLLAAHDRADRFLGTPAIDLAARELGPRNIHVAHLIIDAGVDTAWVRERIRESQGDAALAALAPGRLMRQIGRAHV